jgi:hypothetical protein
MSDFNHTEDNIRKLLSRTEPELQLPQEARQRILSELYNVAAQKIQQPPQRWRKHSVLAGWPRYAAAAAILICVLVALHVLRFFPPSRVTTSAPPAADRPPAAATTLTAEESKKLDEMLVLSDVQGLLLVLSSGSHQARIVAANYVALIGDPAAIPAIEALSREYSARGEEDPFAGPLKMLTAYRESGSWPTPEEAPSGTAEPPRRHIVILRLLEKASPVPISDANVVVTVGKEHAGSRLTDATGSCYFVLSDIQQNKFSVEVSRPGYVPSVFEVAVAPDSAIVHEELRLPPAVPVGGLVRTIEGLPVAGARVAVLPLPNEPNVRENLNLAGLVAVTGDDGHWVLEGFPAAAEGAIVSCTHTRYVQAVEGQVVGASFDVLRGASWPMTMVRGIRLAGVIRLASGRPLAGARVRIEPEYPCSSSLEAVSDTAGKFAIPLCRPGQVNLVVTAEGYTRSAHSVYAEGDRSDVEIVIGLPQILSGRVLDASGSPIADVNIWPTMGYSTTPASSWKTKTDAAGFFRWESAPTEPVTLFFNKTGYMATWQQAAGGQRENVVVMVAPILVSGKVTDAVSGLAVPEFRVTLSASLGESLNLAPAMVFADGVYQLPAAFEGERYFLDIEADGYVPLVGAPLPPAADRQIVFDAALEPEAAAAAASTAVGSVQLPDGTPAGKASVYVASRNRPVSLRGGKAGAMPAPAAVTNEEGLFTVALPKGPCLLVVVGEEGFACVQDDIFAETSRIELRPWGRIEGVLAAGRTGAASQVISASSSSASDRPEPYRQIAWFSQYMTVTEPNGHFVFDRLAPARYHVTWKPEGGTEVPWDQYVTVLSGQTTTVALGD